MAIYFKNRSLKVKPQSFMEKSKMNKITSLTLYLFIMAFSINSEAAPINFLSDSRISSVNQSADVVIANDGLSFSMFDTGAEFLFINFMTPNNTIGVTFDYSYTPVFSDQNNYYNAQLSSSGTTEDWEIFYGTSGNISNTSTLLFQPGNTFHDMLWTIETFPVGTTIPPDLVLTISNVNFQPVPIPAAVWLFGSGLIGLLGIARRKKV